MLSVGDSDQLPIDRRFQQPPWVPLTCQSSSKNSEKHLLTRLLVYHKRYSQRKTFIGQDTGEGCGVSMPTWTLPSSPNLRMFPSPEALSEPSLWVFIEDTLHRHNRSLVIELNLQFLFLPLRCRDGTEVQTLYPHGQFPLQPVPSLRDFQAVQKPLH